MKNLFTCSILIVVDLLTIGIVIFLAFLIHQWFSECFERSAPSDLSHYLSFVLLYLVLIGLFYSHGMYTKRYDFWQELERGTKAIILSAVIVFAVLAMTKHTEGYSRFILIVTFVLLIGLLPIQKYILKRVLFNFGWWKREASIIGEDPFFEKHVFNNPYLGYVPIDNVHAKTIFISSSKTADKLENILHSALINRQEVIFIPMVKNFDFSGAHIIHLFNARANLIIVENNLLSKSNKFIKTLLDYVLSIIILPLLLFIIALIALKIKREDGGSIFFKQTRMGQDSKDFGCYKFRSMRMNGDALLESYLAEHPKEIENYAMYHKYENDPRITKIGAFIRRTSLDELPQIFNVLKGEMSLIGPRPYMPNERNKIGDNIDIILAVKPGITGLWQVSGRSELDFMSRVDLDVWYVRNWSIWKDMVVLIKTVQVVIGQKGSS